MSKFNKVDASARGGAGVVESTNVEVRNHKGAVSYTRTAKSELFLLGISDFVEDTFYESVEARQDRVDELVKQIVVTDLEWLKGYVAWLREEGNMRSVSLTIALRAAKAMNELGLEGARPLVASALRRADEPGEALAFWHTNYGRKLPSAVKRGIADAAVKSYNEYSYSKYDSARNGYRFADVIQLTHPKPKNDTQDALFKYALTKRYNSDTVVPEELEMLGHRDSILSRSKEDLRALVTAGGDIRDLLGLGGLTWEALSGSISGGMDAEAWEAIIPSMGYMALLRNLRNFQDANVSREVLEDVAKRISDKDEVARSRQLPFRFMNAYRELQHVGYNYFLTAIEDALEHSLANVPVLDGNTLILIDNSGSMYGYGGGKMTMADTANLFGVALAKRAANATVVVYGTESEVLEFRKGSSTFHIVQGIDGMGGTATYDAIQEHYGKQFDRVVHLTDEQNNGGYYRRGGGGYWGFERVSGDVYDLIDQKTPIYIWNLAGYKSGAKGKANRYTLGGLTDSSFRTIPLVEMGKDEVWPWEVDKTS